MLLPTCNKTALRALRVFRSAHGTLPAERHGLPRPDPFPQRRWSKRIVPLAALGLASPPNAECPVDVISPDAASRTQASFFSCHVISAGLPTDSFLMLGNGLCIPCPELLFLQMATIMTPEAHALLGYELCGTYSRSATEPRTGEVTYGVSPATSVEKIARYLDRCGRRADVARARRSLERVCDNAWSPMEAVVALMACLPTSEGGYGLGEISLNVRHNTAPELAGLGCRESRVPDIEVAGTRVGFNYDSHAHFDLDSIAAATIEGSPDSAIRDVREKYLDDLRRNRELAAMGRIILSVTPADLFTPGGLDAVMLEAALAMEEFDGRSADNLRACLGSQTLTAGRQRLIWSLLPWPEGRRCARKQHEGGAWRHEGGRT